MPLKRFFQGFTLIELILVIVVIGIMALIAIPRFANLSQYRARAYYDDVLNSLSYARKLAVGKNLLIQVDVTSTNITLRQRIAGTNCTTGATFNALIDPQNNVVPYIKNAPSGITISPMFSFYFDGLGRAYLVSGTATTCSLIDTQTLIITGSTLNTAITITGETGFVQGSL